jgi:hypothetical protein
MGTLLPSTRQWSLPLLVLIHLTNFSLAGIGATLKVIKKVGTAQFKTHSQKAIMFGLFKKKESGPFMEHPTGDFEAMEDAVTRLRKLPKWEQWITFSAPGEGHGPDSYQFAEVRMLADKLEVGDKPLDVARVVQAARTGASLVADGAHYSVAAASPREVAQLLDAIFRHHFHIRPFADEDDDYAVGAES